MLTHSPYSPMFNTPEQYISDKLRIVMRDFKINPTDEDIRHLYTLKTEREIDRAFRDIFDKYL